MKKALGITEVVCVAKSLLQRLYFRETGQREMSLRAGTDLRATRAI